MLDPTRVLRLASNPRFLIELQDINPECKFDIPIELEIEMSSIRIIDAFIERHRRPPVALPPLPIPNLVAVPVPLIIHPPPPPPLEAPIAHSRFFLRRWLDQIVEFWFFLVFVGSNLCEWLMLVTPDCNFDFLMLLPTLLVAMFAICNLALGIVFRSLYFLTSSCFKLSFLILGWLDGKYSFMQTNKRIFVLFLFFSIFLSLSIVLGFFEILYPSSSLLGISLPVELQNYAYFALSLDILFVLIQSLFCRSAFLSIDD